MKSRSYIGDGVYASFDKNGNVVLELEVRGKIILEPATFTALVEFVHHHKPDFDPHCQLVNVPRPIYSEVVSELRELEKSIPTDVKPAH